MQRITLYTREGCHLCEQAAVVIEKVRRDLPFELREVDISVDDSLHAAYLERIPVVALNGEELFEYVVDEALLRQALLHDASAPRSRPRIL